MKAKKLLLYSLATPSSYVIIVLIREFILNSFRISKHLKFIYTYGNMIAFFTQLLLILCSLLIGLYILKHHRRYSTTTNFFGFILGSSLFIYFTTMMIIAFIF